MSVDPASAVPWSRYPNLASGRAGPKPKHPGYPLRLPCAEADCKTASGPLASFLDGGTIPLRPWFVHGLERTAARQTSTQRRAGGLPTVHRAPRTYEDQHRILRRLKLPTTRSQFGGGVETGLFQMRRPAPGIVRRSVRGRGRRNACLLQEVGWTSRQPRRSPGVGAGRARLRKDRH